MGTTARLLSLLAPAFAFMVAPKSLAAEVDESWWQVVSARIQHEEYARDPILDLPVVDRGVEPRVRLLRAVGGDRRRRER